MKKILIAILLLVPLIIIFTLNVSGSIVNAQIEIAVEHLQLKHMGEVVDYVVINLEEYTKTNKQYTLFPEFTPTYVSNKDIDWKLSDESMASLRKSGNGIAVSFKEGCYGKVDVIATAKSNTSISAVCSFYITGKVIGKLDFYDYNTLEKIDYLNLKLHQSKCIEARALPFAALGENRIEWTSSNESVVSVNQNGVLTANSKGVAQIMISIKDNGTTLTNAIAVSVNDECLSTQSTIYTSSKTVDLSPYFTSSLVKIANVDSAAFSGSIVTLGENTQKAVVTLTDGVISEKIILRYAQQNQLTIDYLDQYEQTVWAYQHFVPLGTKYFPISASCGANKPQNITWSSDNPAVAIVEDGLIKARQEGVATLTATANGYISTSVEIVVTPKIGDVRLELDELGDVAGLHEERVWGLYTCYANLNVTNYLQMRINYVYPEEITQSNNIYDYFMMESSDDSLATVGENGLVIFSRQAIGKKVTISIVARFPEHSNVSDSYTFNVVDGINIGYDVPIVRYDKDTSDCLPDFTPAYEVDYVMREYTGDFDCYGTMGALVFQNNVYLPLSESGDDSFTIKLMRSIYGNGYIADGQLHDTTYDSRIFETYLDYENFVKYHGNVYDLTIENLVIQSYSPISDDSEEAFKDLKLHGGTPIRIRASDDPNIIITHVFRYCIFRYAYAHINMCGGPAVLDGCIFSNCAAPAILHQSCEENTSPLTIRNCIFSNTIAPVYLASRGDVGDTEDLQTLNYIQLKIEGENYIYNWKLLNEVTLDIIPHFDKQTLDNLIDILNSKISSLFKLVMQDPPNEPLTYKHVKGDYVNFSFVFIGIWSDLNFEMNPNIPESEYGMHGINVICDENKYTAHELHMDKLNEFVAENIIYSSICNGFNMDFLNNKCYFITTCGKNGVYNTKPGDTYQLDEETKNKVHGIKK